MGERERKSERKTDIGRSYGRLREQTGGAAWVEVEWGRTPSLSKARFRSYYRTISSSTADRTFFETTRERSKDDRFTYALAKRVHHHRGGRSRQGRTYGTSMSYQSWLVLRRSRSRVIDITVRRRRRRSEPS